MKKFYLSDPGYHTTCYDFQCPGCKCLHRFVTKRTRPNDTGPTWDFNGDIENPTFSPSLLYQWTKTDPNPPKDMVCHLFLKEGKIQFLSDCTHEFAGQTVSMIDLEGN